MKILNKQAMLVSLMAAGFVFVSTSVNADTVTFNTTSVSNPDYVSGSNGSGYGNQFVFNNDGVTLTASALYAEISSASQANLPTSDWSDAELNAYTNGLGVNRPGSDPHTVDNYSDRIDGVKFSFSESVAFKSVDLADYNDTDISVFYRQGNTWIWVEDDWVGNPATRYVNDGHIFASEWLISASTHSWDQDPTDKFKIGGISVKTASVPDESNTLMLFSVSVGLMSAMRFLKKKS